MGFWDKKVKNSFDKMFDFDRDGELDSVERSMQLDFIDEGIDSDDDEDEDEDDILMEAGLDPDELADMDEDERREALEEAGFDPDDFENFDDF